jgi:hypothetical protein
MQSMMSGPPRTLQEAMRQGLERARGAPAPDAVDEEAAEEEGEATPLPAGAPEGRDHMERLMEILADGIVTEEEFAEGLEIMAMMRRDPAAALQALAPHVESLRLAAGGQLPAGWQVGGGPPQRAQAGRVMAEFMAGWAASDPDFPMKKDRFLARFGKAVRGGARPSPAEVAALCARCRQEVDGEMRGMLARPAPRRPVTGGAARPAAAEPRDIREAMEQAVRGEYRPLWKP